MLLTRNVYIISVTYTGTSYEGQLRVGHLLIIAVWCCAKKHKYSVSIFGPTLTFHVCYPRCMYLYVENVFYISYHFSSKPSSTLGAVLHVPSMRDIFDGSFFDMSVEGRELFRLPPP